MDKRNACVCEIFSIKGGYRSESRLRVARPLRTYMSNTWTVARPRLVFIPHVFSAPSFACWTAIAKGSPERNVSEKGASASMIVRSPI